MFVNTLVLHDKLHCGEAVYLSKQDGQDMNNVRSNCAFVRMFAVITIFFLVLQTAVLSEVLPVVVKPAINLSSDADHVGLRPYEMKNRTEDRTPLFGFEDLSGWRIECLEGADGELVRTREQQMWGKYVGKLSYTGKSEASRVVIRPPQPIPIPEEFDCINMWIYGNLWEWAPEPGVPFVNIHILLADSSGNEESVYLTRVRWKEWWLAHKKLEKTRSGMSFCGIEIAGMNNVKPQAIFLDSIYFYKEHLGPLEFEPRPARNLTPFPGQDQGLNGTGTGRLPFPTREETILPCNFEKSFSNDVKDIGDGSYVFSYSGKDCRVQYTYRPTTGRLDEITASIGDNRSFVPMRNGGLEFGGTLRDGRLLKSSLSKGELSVIFEFDVARVEYRMRIWQKSLVIDFICRGGAADGLNLGEVSGVDNPKLVLVPYLTFGASNPRILCFGDVDKPQFVSAWVDWYRSNASALWSKEWVAADSAKINGGVRYIAKTDGRRDDLYERVFLTVSPIFEETLPTIANPPTPHGQIAGERLWQESWGPENYKNEHTRSKMLRSYGIEKLTQCNHEITWRDGGESFTLRTKAAPKKGGDAGLKWYIAAQKNLGWLCGLYTNYTDFAPVNEYWNEDYVQRTPEGDWRPAWPRCYALKPSRAVELDAKLAPIIKKKFGATAAYTDVHTAVAPWGYCDFDARVPGAGTFAATFYAYGELLLNDQRVYGPTWSEGTYQCFYAGLATGNYGLAYTNVDLSQEPLNVAFDLMKIHTLECDIGMPWTGGFFKQPGWDKPEKIDESIDHFIAATIAYGHIGWLVEEQHGIQRTCRSYYMLQALQKRYALQAPLVIRYADLNGNWYSVSKAIASDVIKLSRLNVRYQNGLDIYINGSPGIWALKIRGKTVELPPWGWYARHKGFTEFSALIDGRRADYVESPEYRYLDGRGIRANLGGLLAKGSIAVRDRDGGLEIINIYGNDLIGFHTDASWKCTGYDQDGQPLETTEIHPDGDGVGWIAANDGTRRYVLEKIE